MAQAQFKWAIAAILSQKMQQATLFMHDFCRHLQHGRAAADQSSTH